MHAAKHLELIAEKNVAPRAFVAGSPRSTSSRLPLWGSTILILQIFYQSQDYLNLFFLFFFFYTFRWVLYRTILYKEKKSMIGRDSINIHICVYVLTPSYIIYHESEINKLFCLDC